MSDSTKQAEKMIGEQVLATLAKYPELIRQITVGTLLHRIQPSRYDANPINYRAESDTRYADPAKQVGVYYLGFSEEVAMAESFQPGQGVDDQSVCLSSLEQASIHQLKAARQLSVVDVAALANRATHHKLRHLVQAKGQGREGYALTQKISRACMALSTIDGLLYPSAVYTVSGSIDGCNLVLFDGRALQIEAISHQRVMEAMLANGETAVEFLESLGVALESP